MLVARDTHSFGIIFLRSMLTLGGKPRSSIKVIAVSAHALGIVLPIWVWTSINSLLGLAHGQTLSFGPKVRQESVCKFGVNARNMRLFGI